MNHIKLYVKEVSEERRALTREEWIIIRLREKDGDSTWITIEEYLKDIGYILHSYHVDGTKYGTATFRTETTREATPEEEFAFYELKALELYLSLKDIGKVEKCCRYAGKRKFYEDVLKGKEIYPELI